MIRRSVLCNTLVCTLALMLALTAWVDAQSKPTQKGSKPVTKAKAGPPAVRMTLEPKAMELIRASTDRLASARAMSFTAIVSYESASRFGIPLVYTTRSEVTLQRPDKLRVITPGDGPASEFYYNGTTMTAYAPAEKLVAVADAPPTIDAALKTAYDSAAIYFPFANVMVADPYKDIREGLVVAFYIGRSQEVGGTATDMVAYANDLVFVQAWIGSEDKLPRKVRATYHADPAQRRHEVAFSDWKIDPAVPAGAFTAAIPTDAGRIAFAHPNPQKAIEAKPSAAGKALKSKKNKKAE